MSDHLYMNRVSRVICSVCALGELLIMLAALAFFFFSWQNGLWALAIVFLATSGLAGFFGVLFSRNVIRGYFY